MKIKVFYNSKIVPKGFLGITLWHIFIRYDKQHIKTTKGALGLARILTHEEIHVKQQREMLVLPFFILYALFFILNFLVRFNRMTAYKAIPFEKEAFKNDNNSDYLNTRKAYSWIKYIL
jgi:hypothetical protein